MLVGDSMIKTRYIKTQMGTLDLESLTENPVPKIRVFDEEPAIDNNSTFTNTEAQLMFIQVKCRGNYEADTFRSATLQIKINGSVHIDLHAFTANGTPWIQSGMFVLLPGQTMEVVTNTVITSVSGFVFREKTPSTPNPTAIKSTP